MEEQDYMLFEDYLSDELSKEDIISFNKRLKTDSEFKESFQVYKETSSFLESKFENEENITSFKDNIEKISKTTFNKTNTNQNKKGNIKTINYFLYSLSACVVLLFGIFMFNQFSNPSYSDFSNYGTVSLTVRGTNDALLQTAENAFNTKDFTKADEALKSLIILDENNAELKLYRGIANVELDNFETADALLSNLQKGNSAYKFKATWYLALSKLKQNENEECLQILKTIPEDAEDYNQAQKLINKLD
jgi:hypothetical protein